MRTIILGLSLLAFINTNAQTKKYHRKTTRHTHTMQSTAVDNSNAGQRADIVPYREPINPVEGRMNANGNNTPTYNSTRVMNDGPRRSAIDTSRIK